jgi:hypothetical protein
LAYAVGGVCAGCLLPLLHRCQVYECSVSESAFTSSMMTPFTYLPKSPSAGLKMADVQLQGAYSSGSFVHHRGG